jgi:hypothetical protein
MKKPNAENSRPKILINLNLFNLYSFVGNQFAIEMTQYEKINNSNK